VQEGSEVIVYTANNFDDIGEDYHESYRLQGTLRGLVIYDCCAYAVVERNGELSIHGMGEKGLEQFDTLNLK
jgi:hypothetical protein